MNACNTSLGYAFVVIICVIQMVTMDVKLTFMCENEAQVMCFEVIENKLPAIVEIDKTGVNITGHLVESDSNFITNVRRLSGVADDVDILVGIGDVHVVNAVAALTEQLRIPAFTYLTSKHKKHIYDGHVISINPNHEGLAAAIETIVGTNMIDRAFVICQDTIAADGFLNVFMGNNDNFRVTKTDQTLVSERDSDFDLRLKLLAMHDTGYRLVIVHSKPKLLNRIIQVAKNLSYFDLGYAWILTEESLLKSAANSIHLIPGLLALEAFEVDMYKDILDKVIEITRDQLSSLLQRRQEYNVTVEYIDHNFKDFVSNRPDILKRFKRGLQTNNSLFTKDEKRRDMKFRVLNFVQTSEESAPSWKTVGYVHGNYLDLETVVWPGQSIFGPVVMAREYLKIVTRPAEPFVYVRGPVTSSDDCSTDTACLKLYSSYPEDVTAAIESYKKGEFPKNVTYDIYCCEGIVVDILHSLSVELEFDFLVYFQNYTNYGNNVNGTWNGMIGEVYDGAADMVVGAISITSERMSALTFTTPFYFSSFNMISASKQSHTALLAFLEPFDTVVWFLVIGSATIVAISTSLLEWNSPFGLNPWGKRRKQNYTLGSAVTMVYSIWFGHTVKTKSPKSWPSKVLQNVWAALAIFILASYTANLAAFLAGNAYLDNKYSILDAQLSSKKIGIVKTSAVEEYTTYINAGLHKRFSNFYVKDIHEGILKVRNKQIDLYMDDTPLLEYALSKYDDNCSIKYAAHGFGENAYGFGLKKGSWLKAKIDPYLLNYVELGYVEDIKWRYMGKNRQCKNKLMSTSELQFGLPHTGGLFVMLVIAIGLAILLLIGEHVVYFIVLPKLKTKPSGSRWKQRYVEYFSQRLYKAINGETIKPPAQLLMSKVKQRKFQLQAKIKRQTTSVPTDLMSYQNKNRTFLNIKDITFQSFPDLKDFQKYDRSRYKSNDRIYTISEDFMGNSIEEDGELENTLSTLSPRELSYNQRESSAFKLLPNVSKHEGYENPVFESDDEDTNIVTIEYCTDKGQGHQKVKFNNRALIKNGAYQINNVTGKRNGKESVEESSYSGNVDVPSSFCKTKGKIYETWPSPKTRRRSLKRTTNNHAKSFSNADRESASCTSRIVNEISGAQCRTCSASSMDSFKRRSQLEVKDNRMKSSLRDHAMATLRRSPSMVYDNGAVEALSKEDLLVLWKRSEIELQTKLNRILHQNNHLRQLVHIVKDYKHSESSSTMGSTSSDTQIDPTAGILVSTRL